MKPLPRELIIAIDGPSGSGKSTTARLLARRLGYLYIDTGAMYRAVTVGVLRAGLDPADQAAVAELARRSRVELRPGSDPVRVQLDGEDVSDEIRTLEVTRHVSAVSEVPGVREVLVEAQRDRGRRGGVVLEGRDIGSVVFPDADLKVFMEADLATRALRRYEELRNRGVETTLQAVEADLHRRDQHDSQRGHSPLVRAPDAVGIDTTHLTIEEQVQAIEVLARERRGLHH